MMVLVIDRKSGNERTITKSAYAAKGPKVYEKIGYVNDDGSPIEGSPNLKATQAQQQAVRNVNGAAPVVVRQQLISQPAPTNLEVEETQIESAQEIGDNRPSETSTTQQPSQERKKPGPKPGSRKKAISSNPDENAQ